MYHNDVMLQFLSLTLVVVVVVINMNAGVKLKTIIAQY